jgi:glyoxylase-like metal-dependent hydrolase (beta-lactamase superfamily II)
LAARSSSSGFNSLAQNAICFSRSAEINEFASQFRRILRKAGSGFKGADAFCARFCKEALLSRRIVPDQKCGHISAHTGWLEAKMTTRRELLIQTSALAGAAAAPGAASAFAPPAGKQAPGFYRYKIGDFELTAATDGAVTMPLADAFVRNARREEVNQALADAGMPKDQMTIVFTPLIVNTGKKLVVIDTGYGPGNLAKTNGASGQFHDNLAASGYKRDDVDAVVISHFHPDHINGLLTADGAPAFANAEVLAPAAEWAFWMDDSNMNKAPDAAKPAFANARRVFGALARKPTLYDPAKEIVGGVQPLATPGHTPGHCSFLVTSGAGKALVTSDLTNHPALFLRNPGWHVMFDMDPVLAEQSRRKTFDMAAAEGLRLQGFHYPFPATGVIAKEGDGYRLKPSVWSPVL